MLAARVLPLAAAALAGAPGGWRVPAGPLTDEDAAGHFERFKRHFAKTYATAEEERARFAVFKNKLAYVAGLDDDSAGVNQFADMTTEEFRARYLHTSDEAEDAEEEVARAELPEWDGESCAACHRFPEMQSYSANSLDWSTKGAVTAVKDQGQCDSCYAFGATGDMEGTWFLAGNPLTSLSEQELVSCVGKYANGTKKGCGGGTRAKMFKWVIDKGGIVTESNYPYTSGRSLETGDCQKDKESPVAATFDSYQQVSNSADGEGKIMQALNKLGPITIGISARVMEVYIGGIIKSPFCATKHDHAPLVVGYGTQVGLNGTQDYWKVKNSWGGGWGEKGYFKVLRGLNVCGIATDAVHTRIGGGKRYHCNIATKQCAEADKGHTTMEDCQKQCEDAEQNFDCSFNILGLPQCKAHPLGSKGDFPSKEACQSGCRKTPAPPVVPTPPPTPGGPRFHCDKSKWQCVQQGTGHATVEQCETACIAPGYVCDNATHGCRGVDTPGDKLHVCQEACGTAVPTPIPVIPTAPPTPTPAAKGYHCENDIIVQRCVLKAGGEFPTLMKCHNYCNPITGAPPTPSPATPGPAP